MQRACPFAGLGVGFIKCRRSSLARTELGDWVDPIRETGVVVSLTWFVIRLVRNYEQALISGAKGAGRIDRTTAEAIGRLLRIAVLITAALIILQTFGFSLSGARFWRGGWHRSGLCRKGSVV